MKSASICIIDNNILKGFRNDINYNITNFLNTIGFKINTIVTIPHEKTTIISEVQRLIDSDLVILSAPEVTGCTYDAVAEIFKQRLNPTKENGLAQLSTGLNFTSIFNVYIVPNDWLQLHPVLKQLQRTFLPFNDYLVNYSRFVHISGAHQGKLAEVLDELKDKFDVGVISKQLAEGQRIVLESKNLEEVLQCEKGLKQRLETVGIKQNIWCSMSSVYSLMESTSVIVEAVNVSNSRREQYLVEAARCNLLPPQLSSTIPRSTLGMKSVLNLLVFVALFGHAKVRYLFHPLDERRKRAQLSIFKL